MMKKWMIDRPINWMSEVGKKEGIRGFYLIIDAKKNIARIEVPSDIYGDDSLLYEEEIPLDAETFTARYEDGTPVHIDDGELIGYQTE